MRHHQFHGVINAKEHTIPDVSRIFWLRGEPLKNPTPAGKRAEPNANGQSKITKGPAKPLPSHEFQIRTILYCLLGAATWVLLFVALGVASSENRNVVYTDIFLPFLICYVLSLFSALDTSALRCILRAKDMDLTTVVSKLVAEPPHIRMHHRNYRTFSTSEMREAQPEGITLNTHRYEFLVDEWEDISEIEVPVVGGGEEAESSGGALAAVVEPTLAVDCADSETLQELNGELRMFLQTSSQPACFASYVVSSEVHGFSEQPQFVWLKNDLDGTGGAPFFFGIAFYVIAALLALHMPFNWLLRMFTRRVPICYHKVIRRKAATCDYYNQHKQPAERRAALDDVLGDHSGAPSASPAVIHNSGLSPIPMAPTQRAERVSAVPMREETPFTLNPLTDPLLGNS